MLVPIEWLPGTPSRRSGHLRGPRTSRACDLDRRGHGDPQIEQGDVDGVDHARPSVAARSTSARMTTVRRIRWGDDVLSAIDRGVIAVVAINPQRRAGRRAVGSSQPEAARRAQLSPIAFELRGEVPCEVLRTGATRRRVEGPRATAAGMPRSMAARFPRRSRSTARRSPAEWRLRLTNGRGKASIDSDQSHELVLERRARYARGLPVLYAAGA